MAAITEPHSAAGAREEGRGGAAFGSWEGWWVTRQQELQVLRFGGVC